jgi:hypothetical protein
MLFSFFLPRQDLQPPRVSVLLLLLHSHPCCHLDEMTGQLGRCINFNLGDVSWPEQEFRGQTVSPVPNHGTRSGVFNVRAIENLLLYDVRRRGAPNLGFFPLQPRLDSFLHSLLLSLYDSLHLGLKVKSAPQSKERVRQTRFKIICPQTSLEPLCWSLQTRWIDDMMISRANPGQQATINSTRAGMR